MQSKTETLSFLLYNLATRSFFSPLIYSVFFFKIIESYWWVNGILLWTFVTLMPIIWFWTQKLMRYMLAKKSGNFRYQHKCSTAHPWNIVKEIALAAAFLLGIPYNIYKSVISNAEGIKKQKSPWSNLK